MTERATARRWSRLWPEPPRTRSAGTTSAACCRLLHVHGATSALRPDGADRSEPEHGRGARRRSSPTPDSCASGHLSAGAGPAARRSWSTPETERVYVLALDVGRRPPDRRPGRPRRRGARPSRSHASRAATTRPPRSCARSSELTRSVLADAPPDVGLRRHRGGRLRRRAARRRARAASPPTSAGSTSRFGQQLARPAGHLGCRSTSATTPTSAPSPSTYAVRPQGAPGRDLSVRRGRRRRRDHRRRPADDRRRRLRRRGRPHGGQPRGRAVPLRRRAAAGRPRSARRRSWRRPASPTGRIDAGRRRGRGRDDEAALAGLRRIGRWLGRRRRQPGQRVQPRGGRLRRACCATCCPRRARDAHRAAHGAAPPARAGPAGRCPSSATTPRCSVRPSARSRRCSTTRSATLHARCTPGPDRPCRAPRLRTARKGAPGLAQVSVARARPGPGASRRHGALPGRSCDALAAEIRTFLVDQVSRTGGHLGPEPRRRRADPGAAPGLRLAARHDRLGHRAPGVRPQDPHRPARTTSSTLRQRGGLVRLPEPGRVASTTSSRTATPRPRCPGPTGSPRPTS